MEVRDFIKLLNKFKYIFIIVPVVAVLVTYFLVRNLPDEYVSTGRIATGIIDQTRQLLDPSTGNVQESKIFGEFNNLMEVMKLKKMVDMVSYQLVIHDLSSPTPFRKLPKHFSTYTDEQKQSALNVFKAKLDNLEALSLANSYENQLNELLIGFGYDERSLRKNIGIQHEDYSDFIVVTYTSENPLLSAFIVNTLCQGFIAYHTKIVQQNEMLAVNYLSDLLVQKRDSLDAKTAKLQNYKIRHDVLDLEDQSKTTYGQIVENQNKLLEAQKNMASYQGALENLDKKLDPKDRQYIEQSISKINTQITTSQEQLHAVVDRYVASGFDPKLKNVIDSLREKISAQISQSSDKYIVDPLQTKADLLRQRMDMEMNYNLAKYSQGSIEGQLEKLNSNFKRLVPLDAIVKTYQLEIEIASKEYQDVLNRYNQANLQSKSEVKLIQIEKGSPDIAEPSKKMLLIILAAVGSVVMVVVILFGYFLIDSNIKDPTRLANRSGLPVLGYLNLISGPAIDLRRLWDVEHRERMQQFKDLLRSIRFEIDQELAGEKIVAITSMGDGEGKTLLAISLAYSYAMINKKVLLIDGNIENPSISQSIQPRFFIEDYFKNDSLSNVVLNSQTDRVLGNHGDDLTLLEISGEQFVRNRFTELKQLYDIIIIEAPALVAKNKAKEWLLFANKVVAVFEADQDITNGKKAQVKYLQGLNDKFAGWVLNKSSYHTQRKRR